MGMTCGEDKKSDRCRGLSDWAEVPEQAVKYFLLRLFLSQLHCALGTHRSTGRAERSSIVPTQKLREYKITPIATVGPLQIVCRQYFI